MTFGERLKSARRLKQLTQKELALRIGAAHNSVSNWENNQNKPDPDTIELLCGVLGISPNYLFYGSNKSDILPSGALPLPKMKKVPLLETIACSEPILAEENIEGFLAMPENVGADFCLRCKGDSMINARIFDGDIVYIRQQPQVEDGEIAAVMVGDDEATLKRVRFYPDCISLEPENPKYAPIIKRGADMDSIRILGKAIAFTSDVR